MSKVTRFTCFFIGGAVATALSGCDVQVHDATPDQYPANYGVGMYEIKATVVPDSMVTPGSVTLFGLSGKQRIELVANRAGTEFHGMYAVRCQPSFPLQLKAIWRLQGLATKEKVVPDQPREIKLIEPEPTPTLVVDTTGPNKPPKGGWTGTVKYTFATQADTQITGARIDPTSQDAGDVNSAKSIAVTTPFPVDAQCGVPAELTLTSSAQSAHGNLVIDTNLPKYPHWTTRVEFAPK